MLRLFDIPGRCWPQLVDHGPFIDRRDILISDYWRSLGFEFVDDARKADVLIRKAEISVPGDFSFENEEKISKFLKNRPNVFMIGEPRELAAAAYHFADPHSTLAVAPGTEFHRMYFGRPWADPQLENWEKRLDRFVWIGRPIGHRLTIAKKLISLGVPLDIYSREPWPLDCWKGPASDDVETARAYKYRIACENSNTFGYHSEKLFTGIKSGCLTFYWGDPSLDLSFVNGAFLHLTVENLKNAEDLAKSILPKMSDFMYGAAWEVYSIRSFIDLMAQSIRALSSGQPNAELRPPAVTIPSAQSSSMRLDEPLSDREP